MPRRLLKSDLYRQRHAVPYKVHAYSSFHILAKQQMCRAVITCSAVQRKVKGYKLHPPAVQNAILSVGWLQSAAGQRSAGTEPAFVRVLLVKDYFTVISFYML